MKIAIFGRHTEKMDINVINDIFQASASMQIELSIEESYFHLLKNFLGDLDYPVYNANSDLRKQGIHFMISLGGDGTLLETLTYVKNTPIPVLGINFGRMGFLSNIHKKEVAEVLFSLKMGQYKIEKRSLLELKSQDDLFSPFHFALNDFTLHKRDTGSMIAIETYLNGELFNTYWSDGLIVATPTGSTAYSLSCGGPIIFPDATNFVITPVAPHNLNIRPIIVSENTVISFKVKGRGQNHLVSLDSRYEIVEYNKEIAVQKADFSFSLVKLNRQNFINTLREKLAWGLDARNL